MADNEKEKKTLPKEEALALARQGKDAWNKWAEENPGIKVDFSGHDFSKSGLSFTEFVFNGPVNFARAKFDLADFSETKFMGESTDFRFATISSGGAFFNDTKFSGKQTDFTGVKFSGGNANFRSAGFGSVKTTFSRAEFGGGTAEFSFAKFDGEEADFTEVKFHGKKASFFEAKFDGGSADFSKAEFCGEDADFSFTKFSGGDAFFILAEFIESRAIFRNTDFSGGTANFNFAKFISGYVDFSESKFSGGPAYFCFADFRSESDEFNDAIFAGASFSGPVDMEDSFFSTVPDFRRSTLTAHFTCHEMNVGYPTNPKKEWLFFKKAATNSDADKFRRLKELAVQARDHQREQDFFAKELKAKRFFETTGFSLIPNYLYEWTSDFGRSLWRPVLCLGLTWLIFGLLYGANGLKYAPSPLEPLWNGLKLSLVTLVPFAAISRTAMLEAREALFRSDVNHWLDFAMVFEGILAVIFIFLIGLALRNRFRI